jgi:hypothetical protein
MRPIPEAKEIPPTTRTTPRRSGTIRDHHQERKRFWEAYQACTEGNRVEPDRSGYHVKWAKEFIEFLPEKRLKTRSGKGQKDRIAMLPERFAGPLKEHLGRVKTVFEQDLAQGAADVYLWPAFARKYHNASREWIWQYVFPARGPSVDRHPSSRSPLRHPNRPGTAWPCQCRYNDDLYSLCAKQNSERGEKPHGFLNLEAHSKLSRRIRPDNTLFARKETNE